MEKHESWQVNLGRRYFLGATRGLGALGAMVVLFGKGSAARAATPAAPHAAPSRGGYHETEHIRQYYRSARYW